MDVGEAESFGEFTISNSEIHILREGFADSVINVIVGLLVTMESGWNDGDEENQKNREDFDDFLTEPGEVGKEGTVVELFEFAAESENESGEDGDGAENAKEDTLSHDQP